MAVLFESPLELVSVKLSIAAVVHASEDYAESADPVNTSVLEDDEDLVDDLTRGLSGYTKYRIHIGVVTTALPRNEGCKLNVVKLAIVVGVEFPEKGLNLRIFEDTPKSF